jgi:pyruvyl transferase EpsO
MVREEQSLARAREELGIEAVLAPDAAFALGPIATSERPAADVLWLLRADRERTVAAPPPLPSRQELARWPRKFGEDAGAAGRGLRAAVALNRWLSAPVERGSRLSPLFARAAGATLEPIARRRVELATRTLASGRVVVTDRLHGHVLATLAAIPNVVLDSASGKSRATYATWTSPCAIVRRADDVEAALGRAAELLNGVAAAA